MLEGRDEGERNEIDWAIVWGTSKARDSARIAVCMAIIRGVSTRPTAGIYTINEVLASLLSKDVN
jgi:hypothetical protein